MHEIPQYKVSHRYLGHVGEERGKSMEQKEDKVSYLFPVEIIWDIG